MYNGYEQTSRGVNLWCGGAGEEGEEGERSSDLIGMWMCEDRRSGGADARVCQCSNWDCEVKMATHFN